MEERRKRHGIPFILTIYTSTLRQVARTNPIQSPASLKTTFSGSPGNKLKNLGDNRNGGCYRADTTLVMVGISIFLIRTIRLYGIEDSDSPQKERMTTAEMRRIRQPSPIQTQMLWKIWILFWKGPVSPC